VGKKQFDGRGRGCYVAVVNRNLNLLLANALLLSRAAAGF
jgi:hypothetical protein